MNESLEISLELFDSKIKSQSELILIDIRDENSFSLNHIKNFINVSEENIFNYLSDNLKDKNIEIFILCYKGIKSLNLANKLSELGYKNSYSIQGGFELLKEKYSNLLETNESILNKDERERYSRQIILKEVGVEGQKKLLDSKVLVVGAGGLGSPILMYLASAGVGTIGIIDPDIVDISNLHRQIIHFNKNIGKSKVNSAKETINLINPNTKVITYDERLSETNALNIISNYDIVIDGTDNFTAKYLINDACFLLKKTNIFGSIFKFDGQVSVFTYKENTPCYRCVFPEISDLESIPNCAEAGVIGVLAGIVGNLQAMETIKVILNIGDILESKILLYDSLSCSFRSIKYKQNKNCKLCSKKEVIELKEEIFYCKN
jgi:molybdopterin/thiamine biosynthesis adenylyltransferase/rhodanese-related sulfurtransferase